MRNEVTIVLIVCGTLLALTPPASDYFANQQVMQVLTARHDFVSVNSGLAPMSDHYRFGCWALGAAMIGIGIVGSLRGRCGPPGDDQELRQPPR